MTTTIVSAGQSLVDVCLQELGTVAALFDLADANGLLITDALTPGQVLTVPASPAADADVAGYFAGRGQRLNTGAELPAAPVVTLHDYLPSDFSAADFL